jgi:hypothetical protein
MMSQVLYGELSVIVLLMKTLVFIIGYGALLYNWWNDW